MKWGEQDQQKDGGFSRWRWVQGAGKGAPGRGPWVPEAGLQGVGAAGAAMTGCTPRHPCFMDTKL